MIIKVPTSGAVVKSANQNFWCILTEYSINIGYYTGNSLDHPLCPGGFVSALLPSYLI